MSINFEVASKTPADVSAIGIAVSTDGAMPKEVSLSRKALEAVGFSGKVGQTSVIAADRGAVTVVIGIGESSKVTADSLRKSAAAFGRATSMFGSVATTLAGVAKVDRKLAAQVVDEGISLAVHRYTDLKTVDKKAPKLSSVTLVGTTANSAQLKAGAKRGQVIANAANMARDFASMPPAHLTATMFANHAVRIAGETGLKVEVFNKDQLLAMGCGGIIGVNRGSVEPPRMVRLTYKPAGGAKKNSKPHMIMVG